MPMNTQSNAAQEQIWEAAQVFKATNNSGLWTLYAVIEPTENEDSYEIRVADIADYNEALIALAAQIHQV